MKKSYLNLGFLVVLLFITGCGGCLKEWDEMNYVSIIGEVGTVRVTLGGQLVEYPNSKILYSDTDASTIIIETTVKSAIPRDETVDTKLVYIQGPAVIEFNSNSIQNVYKVLHKN